MRISTRGRYALCVMVDLAQHYQDGYISLKDIASRQGISKKYLEQIIALLNRPNFLITARGSMGGYMLARSPEYFTVAEILELAEGSFAPVSMIDNSNAKEPATSSLAPAADSQLLFVWQGLFDVISNYLSGITLQDIIQHQSESFNYMI